VPRLQPGYSLVGTLELGDIYIRLAYLQHWLIDISYTMIWTCLVARPTDEGGIWTDK